MLLLSLSHIRCTETWLLCRLISPLLSHFILLVTLSLDFFLSNIKQWIQNRDESIEKKSETKHEMMKSNYKNFIFCNREQRASAHSTTSSETRSFSLFARKARKMKMKLMVPVCFSSWAKGRLNVYMWILCYIGFYILFYYFWLWKRSHLFVCHPLFHVVQQSDFSETTSTRMKVKKKKTAQLRNTQWESKKKASRRWKNNHK